jgi:hypothetical protein
MPALNFKKQFVPKILDGTKTFTIRGKRKNPIKPGDTLKLYTGMRTSQCELIGTAICAEVTPVKITIEKPYLFTSLEGKPAKWIPFAVNQPAIKSFYGADGFESYQQQADFFAAQYGLPFIGDLIAWKQLTPAATEAPMMGMSY